MQTKEKEQKKKKALGWIEEKNEVQSLQDEDNVRNSQSQDYFATLESMEE